MKYVYKDPNATVLDTFSRITLLLTTITIWINYKADTLANNILLSLVVILLAYFNFRVKNDFMRKLLSFGIALINLIKLFVERFSTHI